MGKKLLKIMIENLKKVLALKFRYSEKATTFEKNLPLFLTLLGNVKKIGRFFQNFVAFSEYLNFNAS